MNQAEPLFSVLVDETVHEHVNNAADALKRAKALAPHARGAAFVRNAHGFVYSVTREGLVAVCVDVGPAEQRMPGGASWPTAHPLTGTKINRYECVGNLPKLEFIFHTENNDAHLRGVWDGSSWSWDEDL